MQPPSSEPSRELVQAIFLGASSLPDPATRRACLQSACGNNLQLRARVEDALAAQAGAEDFFARGAQALGRLEITGADVKAVEPKAPALDEDLKIEDGGFKLLQKIGEGGCGVVYMAEQEKPIRRRVALKVIKLGMDTKSVIVRFEAERQALALMDHPNIAHVFEAGMTSTGRPDFAMELVKGIRITDYCDQNQLDTRERLELFIQVCQAIQHAHQKGVIHRDIKPSNILVTLRDGVAVPKVIDFGIAKAIQGKLTDQTFFTAYENFIGTPAYMNCEPVVARPPSRVYRFQKLARRNWGVFAAAGAVAAALIIGLSISTVMFFKARESERRQTELRKLAEQAQASESVLRREAEARAKITEAALSASQGNLNQAANLLVDMAAFPSNPSLDAVSAFRSVGEFSARQGQWRTAGQYFWALIDIDKFDDWDVVTLDYQSCGVVLAESKDIAAYQAVGD